MIQIEKKYHFYAAHRNPDAGEKCGRIHGHTYKVKCVFTFTNIKDDGITMLFSDIDKLVEPIIKANDHYFLVYEKDDIVSILEFQNEKFIKVPFPTSAENMCVWLFNQIKQQGLPISRIELAETETSKVVYEP